MADEVKLGMHDRIAALLQEIERESGVIVRSVTACWVDTPAPADSKHLLTGVYLKTRKRAE